MKKIKLLFVDNDVEFSYIIKKSFELTGKYKVKTALDEKEGREIFFTFNPDIVVANIGIPDGMAMVKIIREKDELIPVFLTSGQISVSDILRDNKPDIDNFIKKPYVSEELDAYIQITLRRIHLYLRVYEEEEKDIIRLGKYFFDVDKQTLQNNGVNQILSNRESLILERLCERKGKVVLRKQLLNEFWEDSNFFTSRSLDVLLCKLRKRLSDDPTIKIKTIRKKGFLLLIG